ncbi:hypothetical protein ARNL5_03945, partial [Anaerolineae bacterium]
VDTSEFTGRMEEQRTRAREAGKQESQGVATALIREIADLPPTEFVGYTTTETPAHLGRILSGKYLYLDRTPFYVESGGQVDDSGTIEGDGFTAEVVDSLRLDRKIIHEVRFVKGSPDTVREGAVTARVDTARRNDIRRNHSATHLLHESLRRVLGEHVHQQGSLVAPDRLRFDFPHFGKITPGEIRAIEDMVNGKIADAIAVHTGVDMPIEQARSIPHVKMFFGDKYGDTVRVVTIDESFSVEFCGGTHVASTADIGLFKIIAESSIASGVRRIEAVTGAGLRHYIEEQIQKAAGLDDRIARLIEEQQELERNLPAPRTGTSRFVRPSLGALSLPPRGIDQHTVDTVEQGLLDRQAALESITSSAADMKKELSRSRVAGAAGAIDALLTRATTVNGLTVVSGQVDAPSMDELKTIGDTLRSKLGSGV